MNIEAPQETRGRGFAICLYLVAFVTGAIVMSFEMLGSRYLAPSFGAGIYTWASLISTVLLVLPAFSDSVVQFFAWQIDDIKLGSLAAAAAIMLFPVTFLGMYSPFAIRLLMHSKHDAGSVSGTVYGISTAGSILGTLATTFFLIPLIGTRAITIMLGIIGLFGAALLFATAASWWRRPARVGVLAALLVSQAATLPPVRAEDAFDPQIRAGMLARKDGQIAHLETVYNDIFVTKEASLLKMGFQWKAWRFYQSEVDLADPDDLPMLYFRTMSIARDFSARHQARTGSRPWRRLASGLSEPLSAGRCYRRGRARSRRDRCRQKIFRAPRNGKAPSHRGRRPGIPEP